MKKTILYSFAAMASLVLAGCSEDYTDWESPQSYSAEDAVSAYGVTITAGPEATTVMPDADGTVQLVTVAYTSDDIDDVTLRSVTVNGTEFDADLSDGYVTVDAIELSKVVETANSSRAATATSLSVATAVSLNLTTGDAIYVDEVTTSATFTPAPVPDVDAAGYYILGDFEDVGWDLTTPLWMTDNGDGTYSAQVTTTSSSSNWYKFYMGSYYDAYDWDVVNQGQMGCETNGDDSSWNFVVYEGDPVYEDGVQTPVITGTGTYTLTLDVVNLTYTVESAGTEIWYLVGGCIGDGTWLTGSVDYIGVSLYPMAATADGVVSYTGYFTTDGFKLIRDYDSWDNQWGYSDGYVKNDGGSGNLWVDEAGYYTVTLDYRNDVLTIEAYTADVTEYSTMGVAGGFNSWGFEAIENATGSSHLWRYEISTDEDTELKFLTDSSWSVNWGASDFPSGVGVQNGSNIPVSAGSYVLIFNDIDGGYTFIEK